MKRAGFYLHLQQKSGLRLLNTDTDRQIITDADYHDQLIALTKHFK